MAYEKFWAGNPAINKTETRKLEKDGLKIYDDIPYYAEHGFASIPTEEWDMFKWAGLYLQRPKEDGYFMMRVCVPSGMLTYDQTVTLANIAKDYGRGVYDVTTRQAIQFHWLTIEQMPDIFARLDKVGLSSAGACGDITRNIVGNPLTGIDPNELFDTSSIVKEVYEYFQFNEDFSNLPRKYKLSISSNVHNASNAEINCLSFIPAYKELNGERVAGFHVKVGGGLSAVPFLAETLDVFVTRDRTLDVAVAITTIFRDYGYREKRHRARLKFLVADWGTEKLKEKLIELTGPLPEKGEDATKGWNAGYFYGIHQQKQAGLNYVGINVPVGRLTPDEVLELARISKKYGNGEIRNCNSQNVIIPNIPDQHVEALQSEEIFKKFPIAPSKFIGYAVSCTGIEYCNLALVETKERMKRIAEQLDKQVELDVPVRIHMVGCPNSCGQRQIAEIGLQGIKMKNKDKVMVEAFEIYVGGTLDNGGKLNAKLKGKVEANQLDFVLKEILIYFKDTKIAGESFFDYVERIGTEPLQERLNVIIGSVAV
ncbi:ferredoxin--nitrite reductase [Bacillus canaveralius]|uniref:Ferredoxin--nitrite reductase n=1 Tax=Bacillus canaveralius TaxID=1403243 RepID=A0A2N5GPV9_9BACI|nr:ferredoxin--nitrite reductase [Bacillus canaveralius]PLR84770.1 ferredoxin--nitrite reductase [Bacillus canaveralius]PLS00402.1 ferredoxin--nitrite reductase [Bacillus canaveralius]